MSLASSQTLAALAISGNVAAAGCSSAPSTNAPTFALSGLYEATGAGPISAVSFYDSQHYVLWKASCAAGTSSCSELGTYTLDASANTLTLHSVETGDATTLQLTALHRSRSWTKLRIRQRRTRFACMVRRRS